MNILKRSHKNLFIYEAAYIYCLRHNLNFDTFIDGVFMQSDFNCDENSEFDNICKDLRGYRYSQNYSLKEITDEEYELCFIKFKDEC